MFFLLVLACAHVSPVEIAKPVTEIHTEVSVHRESSSMTGGEFSFILSVAQYCPSQSEALVCVMYIEGSPPREGGADGSIKLVSRQQDLDGGASISAHGFYNYGKMTFFEGAKRLGCTQENPCYVSVDLRAGADGHIFITSVLGLEVLEWEMVGTNLHSVQRINEPAPLSR
jgi:hypothetical protein